MTNPLRALAKSLCPPIIVSAIRRGIGVDLRFVGGIRDWAQALSMSNGYADAAILARVVAATREVVAGRAAYERDSALFLEPATPFHIVATLLRSAVSDVGAVQVIDIGGSLGSTYRQCRQFLDVVPSLRWSVVEQPGFVEAGRREFSDERLAFFESISDVALDGTRPTYLVSSALQYIEDPQSVLRQIAASPGRHLIIDRSPFSTISEDRLCVQHAPRSVYRASYPCWVLSKSLLLEALAGKWRVISDQPSPEGGHVTSDGLAFEFRSLIFEKDT